MFRKIQNPETGNWVNINGSTGKRVLRNYVHQFGGAGALAPNEGTHNLANNRARLELILELVAKYPTTVRQEIANLNLLISTAKGKSNWRSNPNKKLDNGIKQMEELQKELYSVNISGAMLRQLLDNTTFMNSFDAGKPDERTEVETKLQEAKDAMTQVEMEMVDAVAKANTKAAESWSLSEHNRRQRAAADS